MYKIIHIHTDPKFFHDTQRFISNHIVNEIIYIGENTPPINQKLQSNGFKYIIFSENDILEMVDVIKKYDGVVLNDLNIIKKEIINKLKDNPIKIFVRLFGYELYTQLLNLYLSPTSLKYAMPINSKKYSVLSNFKQRIKRFCKIEFKVNKEKHNQIFKRVDAIFLLNEFEYAELKKHFYLPKLIPLHLRRENQDKINLSSKNNTIIIGNSRHFWNNHIDVFRLINKVEINKYINFVLFFNYGPINDYTKKIKSYASDKFNFIEDFIDLNSFYDIYKKSSALVINSYRQHALGNIFSAILYGSKLYLNQKSSTYKWLVSEGFKINKITDLANDLKYNSITLTQQDYEHNIEVYNKLQQKYDQNKFILNVINILKNESPNS